MVRDSGVVSGTVASGTVATGTEGGARFVFVSRNSEGGSRRPVATGTEGDVRFVFAVPVYVKDFCPGSPQVWSPRNVSNFGPMSESD